MVRAVSKSSHACGLKVHSGKRRIRNICTNKKSRCVTSKRVQGGEEGGDVPGKSEQPNQARWKPRHFSAQVGRKGTRVESKVSD